MKIKLDQIKVSIVDVFIEIILTIVYNNKVCPHQWECCLRKATGQRALVVIFDKVFDCCLIITLSNGDSHFEIN